MVAETVRQFIDRHLPQSASVLVGLSGGADSIALLLAIKAWGVKCIATHCNFHLRGTESDRDQRHCEAVCQKIGVKLLTRHFDVEAQRKSTGESIEMACRTLRYNWWNDLISDGVADYIAVGHHREDNVETLFLNLIRGCGIAGVKGMLPVNGYIIRPMLELSRSEIEYYVIECGFNWVTDHTNLENEYSRNRLRNVVLPELEAVFPGATQSISRSMKTLRDNFRLFDSMVCQKQSDYSLPSGGINVEAILKCEECADELLHQILSRYGLNHSQIDDIIGAPTLSGQIFEGKEGVYVLDHGALIPVDCDNIPEDSSKEIPSIFITEIITSEQFQDELKVNSRRHDILYFDARAMAGEPTWRVRGWQRGDRIQPFGMQGSKLVSDIFNDRKIGVNRKKCVPLLFRNDVLMWIVGVRASNHFRVTSETGLVVKLTYRDGDKG